MGEGSPTTVTDGESEGECDVDVGVCVWSAGNVWRRRRVDECGGVGGCGRKVESIRERPEMLDEATDEAAWTMDNPFDKSRELMMSKNEEQREERVVRRKAQR